MRSHTLWNCRAFTVHSVLSPLRATLGQSSHIGMLTGHQFSKMPRLLIDRLISGFAVQMAWRRKKRLSNRWQQYIMLQCQQRHRACRIEIGYYQPADIWHSVAMSNEIVIPPAETSEAEYVDLATIPFHFGFQQLVDLFGAAKDDALATVISRFQTRVVSSGRRERLSSEERKILQRTGVALSELADARRAFNQIDREKLKRGAEALLGLGPTSPSRGFNSTSFGS